MSYYLGINSLNHDSSVAVIDSEKKEIEFAAHSERFFSRSKNDKFLNQNIINEVISSYKIDKVFWHGNPKLKFSRQLFQGKINLESPKKYIKSFGINCPITYVEHHRSHAAAGFFTSKFNEAAIVVIDAIGDWKTLSIWSGKDNNIKKIKSINYPSSFGLLYSSFTKRIGFKPNEEEYILMGMAAYGNPIYYEQILRDFIDTNSEDFWIVKKNLHLGIGDYLPGAKEEDLAASIQLVTEKAIESILKYARTISGNLVYQGGVALNCVANKAAYNLFDNVWIMPAPGDSGGAIGAITANIGHVNWKGPYLGYNIEGEYPIKKTIDILLKDKIVGVANGRAEFGPRAFGNRSLFADPRGIDIKDKVNNIKKRQKFRPFAPVILEEKACDFFEMPTKSLPYMQLTVQCKYPDKFPAIVHVDGSSRVQTVNKKQHEGLYNLLKEFEENTGCPMLLNTSLNIKGQPLVNSKQDAYAFSYKYKTMVTINEDVYFSND